MSTNPEKRPGERMFAIVLTVFSIVALWQAYRISGFKSLSEPGVFPMLAAGTMLVSGLFILRDSFGSKRRTTQTPGFFTLILQPRLIIVIALVGLYIVLMPWLGFIVASGLFLFVCFQYLWRRKILISIVLTLFSLGCIHVIFRIVFQVVLPKGTLLAGLI